MKNIRVLIADDTTFMRVTIKKMLSENGINNFVEAVNGKEAVTKYKSKHPDLVMMDISMPVMDGIEAIRQIRSHDPEARILICSLQGQRDNVMQGIKAGAKGFLVKPLKEEKLINEINKIFDETPINLGKADKIIEDITESVEDVKASIEYINGIEEGYKECKREVATNMLKLGLPLETVRMCVELSDEEVLKYKSEFNL